MDGRHRGKEENDIKKKRKAESAQHIQTHTHEGTRGSRHGARLIQSRHRVMIVLCVCAELGRRELRREERRKKGWRMREQERRRVLNHCVLGDYFPFLSPFSHMYTHTHTTAGGAQARSLCCSLSTLQWEHILTAERCHTPPNPTTHPIPDPSHPAHHCHTNAITTHQSNERGR